MRNALRSALNNKNGVQMALKKRRPESKFMLRVQSSKYGIYIFYLAIFLAVLILCALLYLVIIPAISSSIKEEKGSIVLNEFITATAAKESEKEAFDDLSAVQRDARIDHSRINDPFICGNEIIYSTGSTIGTGYKYNRLMVYNIPGEAATEVENISLKFDNIINCVLSENYIAYIDSDKDGGGSIMGYDRAAKKSFLIKDYLYAAPRISIDGDIICFMQQTGDNTDKLYVYDLSTRESACLKVTKGEGSFPSPASIANGRVIYASHKSVDGAYKSTLHHYNLSAGSEKITTLDVYAASPKTNGKYTIFLAGEPGKQDELWLIQANGELIKIADGVLNCEIGDGFAAYTKDGAVYAYVFETKITYKLSSELTRGLLVAVNDSSVIWYDVTSGFGDMDIVKFAVLGFN